MGTPTLIVARTDAEAAKLLTSDIDERVPSLVDYDAAAHRRLLPVATASTPASPAPSPMPPIAT